MKKREKEKEKKVNDKIKNERGNTMVLSLTHITLMYVYHLQKEIKQALFLR